MTRHWKAAVAILVAIFLAACTSGAPKATQTPTSSPAAISPPGNPATPVAPSASSEATQTQPVKPPADAWLLGPDGYGPVTIDSALRAAQQKHTFREPAEDCSKHNDGPMEFGKGEVSLRMLDKDGKESIRLVGHAYQGVIKLFQTTDPKVPTIFGLSVGDPASKITKQAPKAKAHKGSFYTVAGKSGRLTIDTRDDRIVLFTVSNLKTPEVSFYQTESLSCIGLN